MSHAWPRLLGRFALAAMMLAAAGQASHAARSPVELANRPILGDARAPIVVVEVSGLKCSHCRSFHTAVFPKIKEAYINTGKVQWVVLHASDDAAEQHAPAYLIARSAHQQGKFWEIRDELFAMAERPHGVVMAWARQHPLLDRDEIDRGLRDREIRNAVARDFADYVALKARGTPTFYLRKTPADGRLQDVTIAGAQAWADFQRALDRLLNGR